MYARMVEKLPADSQKKKKETTGGTVHSCPVTSLLNMTRPYPSKQTNEIQLKYVPVRGPKQQKKSVVSLCEPRVVNLSSSSLPTKKNKTRRIAKVHFFFPSCPPLYSRRPNDMWTERLVKQKKMCSSCRLKAHYVKLFLSADLIVFSFSPMADDFFSLLLAVMAHNGCQHTHPIHQA